MSASNSYVARGSCQPRGKRPWCASCNTDLHLVTDSPAVSGKASGSFVIAVRCSRCRWSRVLETTENYVAALPAPPVIPEGLVYGSDGYVHCGNPMFRPGPGTQATVRTVPHQNSPLETLTAYLATEVRR